MKPYDGHKMKTTQAAPKNIIIIIIIIIIITEWSNYNNYIS